MTPSSDLIPFLFRICYADTDAAGFVYHARYLEIFERSRAQWLYQQDLSPSKLVAEFQILLPIRDITMHFHKPGRLDDLLSIDQTIEDRGRTQITVKQTAKRITPDSEPELIASASLNIVCVDNSTLKPKRIPDWLFVLGQ